MGGSVSSRCTYTSADTGELLIVNIMLPIMIASHVIRHAEQLTEWDPAGFTRRVYVEPDGIQSGTCRKKMLGVPQGIGIKPYATTSKTSSWSSKAA